MPKMHQNTFGGRAPPDHLAAMGMYFYEQGPTYKGEEGDGGGEGIPPKVKVSRINIAYVLCLPNNNWLRRRLESRIEVLLSAVNSQCN